jgi:hypothetical protein
MEAKQRTKGSWGLRFFIILLSIVLGVLLYWLLSFIENDIGMMSGPDWTSVRGRYVTVELDEQQKSLTREIDALKRTIQVQTEQQRFLSADTVSQQNTINQLLSIQKQYIDKGQEFPAESIKILQDTQTAFLKNQEKNQRYNQEITELTRQQRDREDTQATLNETIKSKEEEARVEYNKLCENHRIRVAVLKLAFLVPVFLLVSFVFMKYRASLYWPMVWAAFLAGFFKITIVANEYFPNPLFQICRHRGHPCYCSADTVLSDMHDFKAHTRPASQTISAGLRQEYLSHLQQTDSHGAIANRWRPEEKEYRDCRTGNQGGRAGTLYVSILRHFAL